MDTSPKCTNHTLPTPFHYNPLNTITIRVYVCVIKPNTFTPTSMIKENQQLVTNEPVEFEK